MDYKGGIRINLLMAALMTLYYFTLRPNKNYFIVVAINLAAALIIKIMEIRARDEEDEEGGEAEEDPEAEEAAEVSDKPEAADDEKAEGSVEETAGETAEADAEESSGE